jgi:ABC-type multidrug transport system permease subunit
MQPESLLPCSSQDATISYPEPDDSTSALLISSSLLGYLVRLLKCIVGNTVRETVSMIPFHVSSIKFLYPLVLILTPFFLLCVLFCSAAPKNKQFPELMA